MDYHPLTTALITSDCALNPGVLAKINAAMSEAAANATLAACGSGGVSAAADPAVYSTCAGIGTLAGTPCAMTVGELATASGFPTAVDGLSAAEIGSTVAQSCRELCNDCPATAPARMSRSMIYLGWPLKGYAERPKENTEQQKTLNIFWERVEDVYQTALGMEAGTMPRKSALRNEAVYNTVQVWYW